MISCHEKGEKFTLARHSNDFYHISVVFEWPTITPDDYVDPVWPWFAGNSTLAIEIASFVIGPRCSSGGRQHIGFGMAWGGLPQPGKKPLTTRKLS